MIILGLVPSVVEIKLSLNDNRVILEAWDLETRLISFGGPAAQVINWMELNGYRHVRRSRGIWEKTTH